MPDIFDDHLLICHSDGSPCPDGCDIAADPEQLARYIDATSK